MLARLRIRGRLALLVIIPLLSTIGLAVPVLADRIDSARKAADTAESVRLADQVGTLVQDLQRERILSIGFLLNLIERSELIQQTALVGDRIADLRADLGEQATEEITTAIDGIRRLADLRLGVLAGRANPDQVITLFGQVNNALIESLRLTWVADATTPEGRQMIALDAVLRTDEGISAAATLIVLVAATESPTAETAYVGAMARTQSNLARFRSFATPGQNEVYGLVERAVAARTSPQFLTLGSLDPVGAVAGMSVERLFPAVSSLITLGQFIEKKIVTDVVAEMTDQRQRAIAGAYTVGLLVLLIIALMMLLSLAVAGTVARPLTRLTVSAERMARVAEEELVRIADDESESPDRVRLDPVDVRGQDEIGDLARAFERVQGTAARLVERQAASRRNVAQMFGHVGRRTQNLVGRQIALIDGLEQQETDPGRLQQLYRLDHVSSRLRRNASSLVVLSGGAGGDGHVAPLPLGDVVRLALGEIEDYTRVDVQVRLDVAVAPGVIGDLVLTLAELMENATAFSPPHTRVTVLAEVVPGGVRLNLVDHGIGMAPERLAEENARLTRRERLDLVPTEVLGLFVVGRLARRHGWRVTLSETTPGGGVTVGVEIDDRLLVTRHPEPPVATVRASASAPLPVRPVNVPRADPPFGPSAPTVPNLAPLPQRSPTPTMPNLAPLPERSPAPAMPNLAPLPQRSPTPDVPPVAPVPELVPVATSTGPMFDTELITRATRSLASGKPWNAFQAAPADTAPADTATGSAATGQPGSTTHPDGSTAPAALTRPTVSGRPASSERPGGTDRPAAADRPAGGTGPAVSGGPAAGAADSGPGPAGASPGTGLRQRVPGAQLPATTPRGRTEPTPADPSVVRALIEEFEAGVRRAQREQSRPTPTGPRPEQGGAHPEQDGAQTEQGGQRPPQDGQRPERQVPGPAAPSRANGVGTATTTSGAAPPPLNRRVPGANLSIPPTASQPGQAPPAITSPAPEDPDRVRDQIMQFESGVARALNEVRSDNRHEEETPR